MRTEATFENEKPRQCKEDWIIDRETLESLCLRQVVSHKDDRIQRAASQPRHRHQDVVSTESTRLPVVPATTSQVSK
jgi:hypothetical protein